MTTDSLELAARGICDLRQLTFGASVGAGTFKETFRVTDGDGEAIALKVYRPTASLARAEREIEAMVMCDHPNIAKVRFVEALEVKNQRLVYCLEEFLAGGTLRECVEQLPLAAHEARRLLRSLIAALDHLAVRGLVHRDLKPENIMLRADRQTPVVVDFGLVRNLGAPSMTPTWAPQGPCTPFFAPAEQLANEKLLIDWRADQFSLGVTFSLLALGVHPYAETNTDTAEQIINRVAMRKGPALSFAAAADRANLSPLKRMVEPWPVQRYRTPSELIVAWAS